MPTKPAAAAGQSRALWMSTIAFTVCFAVWTIFAIIGIQIKRDLNLNETQFGLLVGTPILSGSLIRIALGVWSDQYGGRIVYTLVMLAAGLWVSYRVVNFPQFADFLIAVEAEMAKVSWPSRSQLIKSSLVVIFTIIGLAAILWMYDTFWRFLLGRFT